MKIIILLAAGAIAYNGTLADVHQRRNDLYSAGLPTSGFICRVGVQNRYADLLGATGHFYDFDTGVVFGPLLVVDMASDAHAEMMERNHIVLDSECSWMVHRHGLFFVTKDYGHNDAIPIDPGDDVISRTKSIMRQPHRLCGAGVACHWKVESWVWE